MNVEMNFTRLDMGLFLCLVCNLGAIRGRLRRVFGSVLFAVLLQHIKRILITKVNFERFLVILKKAKIRHFLH